MVVLVDTNVIIDFLITREPFYKASMEVVMKCARRELEGCIAMHSIPKLWYILRGTPEEKRSVYSTMKLPKKSVRIPDLQQGNFPIKSGTY